MADNKLINAVRWGTVEGAFSGDPDANSQLISLVIPTGSEGSWTLNLAPGTLANGIVVDVSRLPSLPAGGNLIGGVDVNSLPALPAGTSRLGSVRPVDSADGDLTSVRGTQSARFLNVQRSCDAGRQEVWFSAANVGAGATGVETLVTLARAVDTAAAVNASSYAIPAGKRLRITSVTFAARGNGTATAQITTFSFRLNTAGAITTASPARFAARVATVATSNAWDRFEKQMGDGYEILGDGTLQIGVTANAVFVTNAPTWDVLISGYLY